MTKSFFDSIYPLSDEAYQILKDLFKSETYEKDNIFIKVGQKNTSEYIVVDGYCRSFLYNPEGDDISITFYKSNSVLSPHIIRTKNDISLLNLQALTKLELIVFNSDKFLALMIENLEIRNFGNTILLNELMRKTAKEISLASLTARERLINFRSDFGALENLIPHPVIASYLGITNVSLSRLRKEILKK